MNQTPKASAWLSENRNRAVVSVSHLCEFLDWEEVGDFIAELACVHMRMTPPWVAGLPGSPMPLVIAA